MRGMAKAVAWVGLGPWLVASAVIGALFASSGGRYGLRQGIAVGIYPPVLAVCVGVTLVYLILSSRHRMRQMEPTAGAFAIAALMVVTALLLSVVIGGASSRGTDYEGLVVWASFSGYLMALPVASALSFYASRGDARPVEEDE